MTDQRETTPVESAEGAPASQPAPISRRTLLRGAAVAVPTILTLNSGAALANASNLMIGGSRGSNNMGAQGTPGYFVCLQTGGQTEGNYRLIDGNPGTGIPTGKKFKYKDAFGQDRSVYGDDACAIGGTKFKYNGREYAIPKGMLLSAAAYSSLAAGGVIDIKFLNL